MAYNKRTWLGRQGTGLNKFSIGGASPVTIVNQPDSVTQVGDALSAGNLNDLEDRIEDAFDDVDTALATKADQTEVTNLNDALDTEVSTSFHANAEDVISYANLYDKNSNDNIKTGYYNRSGNLVTSADVWSTHKIPVLYGETYYIIDKGSGFVVLYDENGTYIGYKDCSVDGDTAKVTITNTSAKSARFVFGSYMASYLYVFNKNVNKIDGYTDYCTELIKKYGFVDAKDSTLDKEYVNLYDPNAGNSLNGYLSRTGVFTSSETVGQTDMIRVIPGFKYKNNATGSSFILWFNEIHQRLSYSEYNEGTWIEAPQNARFAKFILLVSQVNDYAVYCENIYAMNPTGISNFNGLNGVAFGTSLTYRSQTTGGYLQYLPALSGITFDNQGLGSSTILPHGSDPNMLNKIKTYANYASKRVCILEGFVNDWGYNYDNLGTWTDTTETTVCGCVRSALNYIMSQNANMTIFLVLDHYGRNYSGVNNSSTSPNGNGDTQYEFYEEIAKVGESLGIPVIKQYATSGISENTPQYLLDNIHMNELGAKQSAYNIWEFMKNYYPNQIS